MKAARLLAALCCLVAAAPFGIDDALARRARTSVHIGAFWGGPVWGTWWGHPAPWPSPVVIRPEQPWVYIERPAPPSSAFWYYCRDPAGYYPYVGECRESWLPVLPQQENRP